MTSASDELELPAGARPATESRTAGEETEDGASRGPLLAPLMARAILAVFFGVTCAFAVLLIVDAGTSFPLTAIGTVYLVILFALQLFYFSRPDTDLRSPLTYAVVAVQAALTFLPFLQLGYQWIGIPTLLAGTVLLVLPPRFAWPVFAAIVVATALVDAEFSHTARNVAYTAVATIVAGLEVYGLTRMAGLIVALHAARAELANSAVAHERLRFARDLHDLLGLSLSAIAPRGELTVRLVDRNPERARTELSSILAISRKALADVRAVAHGYRDLNLDEESRTAESVLTSSRVDVRMELNHGELPVHIRTLLAAVLREGVANVLEHSEAERCDIIMRQAGDRVSLDIVNDGVVESPSDPEASNGLAKLSDRVARLRGEFTTGLDPDGRFRLHVSVPVAAEQADRTPAEPEEQTPRSAVLWARVLVGVVFFGVVVVYVLNIGFSTDNRVTFAVVAGYLLMLLLIQLLYFNRPATMLRSPASYALLAIEACLAYVATLQFGVAAIGLHAFLAGSVLLVLRPALAWPVFAAILAIVGWVQAASDPEVLPIVSATALTMIGGLVVYGMTWMVRSMAELRAARIQLAKVAVAEERLRFARDLHDLLGLSLSAITLKTELAHRLVTAAPDKAREEVNEILAISRLALADVRLVASGYRDLSLDEEFRTAESLLAAADVDVRLDLRVGELPDQVGTLLATVLREGVTNVLRHSKGEHCEITVEQQSNVVYLDIVNDGVAQTPAPQTNGSGISNLSYRVSLYGGELTAGLEPDGRFRLRAKVPA